MTDLAFGKEQSIALPAAFNRPASENSARDIQKDEAPIIERLVRIYIQNQNAADLLKDVQQDLINKTLNHTGGSRTKSAQLMGMSRTHFYRTLRNTALLNAENHFNNRAAPTQELVALSIARGTADTLIDRVEIKLVDEALTYTGGNKQQAARVVGRSRWALHRWLEAHPDL